jgi:hypothetical protein
MKKVMLLLLSVLVLSVSAQRGNGRGMNGNGLALSTLPLEPLSDAEKASLLQMREEEKLAHDVYVTLFEKWKLAVFENIAASETQHTGKIKELLDRYQLQDPYQAGRGEFTNADLKALYQKLVEQGMAGSLAASQVGATIEDLDIFDLQQALNVVDNKDIRLVYQNLMKGSRNHLRAFVRSIESLGSTYEARYLSQEEVQDIIDSSMEQGPVDQDGHAIRRAGSRGRWQGQGTCGTSDRGQGNGNSKIVPMGSYPNPANPTTTLVYELAEPAAVTIQIFNLRGQMVRTYNAGVQNTGEHQQIWDGKDIAGNNVSSGVYICRFVAGNETSSQRIFLVR